MRTDLALLRSKQEELAEILAALELELVEDPRWGEPSDTSYLSDRDRANPAIMANVDAMTATNMLIDWFGRDMEGFVGFWRGPETLPAETAPVVRLDTEGQYALIASTVGDYLLVSADHGEGDVRAEVTTTPRDARRSSARSASRCRDRFSAASVQVGAAGAPLVEQRREPRVGVERR